jgi:hypothetical protein
MLVHIGPYRSYRLHTENYSVCNLLGLAFFTQHSSLEIHSVLCVSMVSVVFSGLYDAAQFSHLPIEDSGTMYGFDSLQKKKVLSTFMYRHLCGHKS